jgi:carbamoyl-phosphate synthase large subunit
MPGVAVINALKEQRDIPVRVIGSDMSPLSAGFLLSDGGHVVPAAHKPEFIPTIHKLCATEQIQVIFPVIDEELQVFADHVEAFAQDGIRVISNPPETVRLTKDKLLTARRCEELGVLAPPTLAKENLARQPLPPFPLIVKPRDGRGTVGVHTARDRRELDFFVQHVPNPIIQQCIEGPEFTIDVLTDFDGRPLSIVPKERLQVKGGMQVKGRTVKDQRLLDYGVSIAQKFRVFPRGNIQCIRARDGRLFLIEINPKFAASLPFTVAAGVNAPLLLLKMHLGQKVPPMLGQFEEGLVMLRCWRELYLHEK